MQSVPKLYLLFKGLQMTNTAKQGVFTKLLKNGCTNFYIKYSIYDKQYKVKLGSDMEGWTLSRAEKERYRRISNNIAPIAKKVSITLDMAFEEYYLYIKLKSDTRNTRGRYENHIKGMLGHIPLAKITVADIQRLRLELVSKKSLKTGKPLAPKTQNDMIDLVNTIYRYYNKTHLGASIKSPAHHTIVDRHHVDNSRTKFLTREEYQKLLWFIENRNAFTLNRNVKSHITKRMLLYVKLLVTTGVRTNSALTIRCKDLNFEAGTIHIINHKSKRTYTAYIHNSIRDELEEICNKLPSEYYVFGEKSEQLHKATLNKRLTIVMDKVFNEHVTDRREKVVTHTLRHTFGSWLVQQGTSLYIVSKLMDHTRVEQTQMYAKLLPDSGANEVSKLCI